MRVSQRCGEAALPWPPLLHERQLAQALVVRLEHGACDQTQCHINESSQLNDRLGWALLEAALCLHMTRHTVEVARGGGTLA